MEQVWRVRIEDADRTVVAWKDFEDYDEAKAMHDALLDFNWLGFWAAPMLSPVVKDEDGKRVQ